MYGRNEIITYSEYLIATMQKKPIDRYSTEEEVKEFKEGVEATEKSTPTGFYPVQNRACSLIRKCLAQVHLFPRNRADYLDLKEDFGVEEFTHAYHYEPMNYKGLVCQAIAIETKFMHDNDVYFENGYVNLGNTFQIGSYNAGGQQPGFVEKLFNKIHPDAYNCLEQMGGTYGSLDSRLEPEIFYKGEH